MKKHRPLLLLLALATILGLVLFTRAKPWAKSSYESFVSHPVTYFVEVAHACDLLLKEHEGITNRFLSLAGNEPSLPETVRRLHANEVRVYHNRVWIGFEAQKDSFAILWEPQSDA